MAGFAGGSRERDRPQLIVDGARGIYAESFPAATRPSVPTSLPARDLVLSTLDHAPAAPDAAARRSVEESTGVALAGVRVYRGLDADRATGKLGAHAFTIGDDIVVGSAPRHDTLRHELAHVAHGRAAGATRGHAANQVAAERFAEEVARGARPAIPATSVPVLSRQPVQGTRLDRGFLGEQNMGFVGYSTRDGWVIVEGPSGSAGHRANAPGFDAVAVRVRGSFEIHLVDNKSFQSAGNVSSATAITTNLASNLDALIGRLAGTGAHGLDPAQAQRVLTELRAARGALRAGTPLPGAVRLIVTNAYGASTGVTQRLSSMGVRFRDLNPRPAGSMPPSRNSPGTRGAAPGRSSSGARGAAQGVALALHQAQVRHIEAAQMRRAEEALTARQPLIDAWRRQGRWVVASIVMNEPRSVDLLRGVFMEPGQIAMFHHVSLRWGSSEAEAQNPPARWEPGPPPGASSTRLLELPDSRVLRSYDAVVYPPITPQPSTGVEFDISTITNHEFAMRFLEAIQWFLDPTVPASERTAQVFTARLVPYDLRNPSIRADAERILGAIRLQPDHRRTLETILSR